MPQKLPAMRYIKNNKRRTAVLIVSLCLCFVLTYITQFLLSTTEESFKSICLDTTSKMSCIQISLETYGIDTDIEDTNELIRRIKVKRNELIEKLKAVDGIKNVYNVQCVYACIAPLIGEWYYEVPLVEKEELPVYLEHFGAKLSEGKMPENPGEIVLDSATMANNDFKIGSYLDERDYEKDVKIVGILDCDYYFGCGIRCEELEVSNTLITVLTDKILDMKAILISEGYNIDEKNDTVQDYEYGKNYLKKEITDAIDFSTTLIFIGIIVLLSIALFIVYTTYLRDRRNEWCLYCSIGYSRRTIYASIMRELLFTFGVAIAVGALLIVISELILCNVMIIPQGLRCCYFNPITLGEIFCSYALLLGLLQIPVRYALFKIRTIDAMDDDLY